MLLLAHAGCEEPMPQAFDWRNDRTLVPALNLVERTAEEGTARRIDALVLSPWPIQSIGIEVCGLVTDAPASVFEASCFSEPSLVQEVATGITATWTPPDLSYACEGYVETLPTPVPDTGAPRDSVSTRDSGGGFYGSCGSWSLLRVVAHTSEDEGSAMVSLGITPYPVNTGHTPDPSTGDPLLEVASGEPRAGGEITLRFSTSPDWQHDNGYRWYVDDGELTGTGRTGVTGTLASGRPYSDNTLRIPDHYTGPLRVAVVTGSLPQVWQVITLEVP
jgi:hypothetical protein